MYSYENEPYSIRIFRNSILFRWTAAMVAELTSQPFMPIRAALVGT